MIEIIKLRKVYNSKSKNKCIALNDISFNLPDTGMIFICGKSGSGKSTLLNILGGLDSSSHGDIIVDGNYLSKFTDKEFDDYRNSYVGFIFQDFYLIDNFNVEDNIKLSLNLKGEKDTSNICEMLNKVDLNGYEKRFPKELSGGQKQRVAIARCLIKSPKLILADEPTGNLDNKTATQILTLLKELSKERLVVVVSHSLKDANEYADRIIELSDGDIFVDKQRNNKIKRNLIEDNLIVLPINKKLTDYDLKKINKKIKEKDVKVIQEESEFKNSIQPTEVTHRKIEKSKNIPLLTSTIMANKFLKGNKLHTIVTSIIVTLVTLLICFSQMFASFDQSHLINQALKNTDSYSFTMNKGYYEENWYDKTLQTETTIKITDADIQTFYDNGYEGNIYKLYNTSLIAEYEKDPFHSYEGGKTMKSYIHPSSPYIKQGYGVLETDIDFLTKLYGNDEKLAVLAGSIDQESNENGFIITDYFADAILYYNPIIFDADSDQKYQNIVNYGSVGYRYNVSAVIDTGYKERYKEIFDDYQKIADMDTRKEINEFIKTLANKQIYKDFVNEVTKYLGIGYSLLDNYKEQTIDNAFEMTRFLRFHNSSIIYDSKILAENLIIAFSPNNEIQGNQVYVGADMYNSFFGTRISYEDQEDFEQKTITLKLYNKNRTDDDLPLYTQEYVIIGLSINNNGGFQFSKEEYVKVASNYVFAHALYFDDAESGALLHDIGQELGFYSNSYYFKSIYIIMNIVNIFSEIFSMVVMALISLELILLISFSIRTVKKKMYEIGVLRALGGRILQVAKTFILQVLFLGGIICVLCLIAMLLLSTPINNILVNELAEFTHNQDIVNLNIIQFDISITIIIFISILAITFISSLLPILFIKKVKPINIIKNKE